MLNAEPPPESANRDTPTVAFAPIGAAALAGVATATVLAIWLAFYFLVFAPRTLP